MKTVCGFMQPCTHIKYKDQNMIFLWSFFFKNYIYNNCLGLCNSYAWTDEWNWPLGNLSISMIVSETQLLFVGYEILYSACLNYWKVKGNANFKLKRRWFQTTCGEYIVYLRKLGICLCTGRKFWFSRGDVCRLFNIRTE